MAERKKALWRADEIGGRESTYTQRLNADSLFRGASLSRLAGMSRAHVSIARVPPGKESFAYHAHRLEEEWIYVLAGRGIAEIDGGRHEVGPGDFMGFAAPQVPHLMSNPFDVELVYLMGGEDVALDVIDYPKLGKRFLLAPGERGTDFYELGEPIRPFGKADR
jgi:uncharacterized cupin superfamily protein